jgi:hypothetical protein
MSEAVTPYRSPQPPVVPDHGGERQPDAVYCTPPDPSIGPLVSAWSNQTVTGFRGSGVGRVRLIVGVFFGVFIALFALALLQAFGPLAGLGFGALAGAALTAFLALGFRPTPSCSYVGEDGMSHHRLSRRPQHRFLRFAEAEGMWIARTDHIENGFYKHTIVEYTWRDRAGRPLRVEKLLSIERGIAGASARLGARLAGGPVADAGRSWIAAGERRWLTLRRARAQAHLAEAGAATFPLAGGGYLAVRPGEIEASIGGKRTTLRGSEVTGATWKDGILTLHGTDSGPRGALSLRAADVGDLEVALETMREVAGIDVAPAS